MADATTKVRLSVLAPLDVAAIKQITSSPEQTRPIPSRGADVLRVAAQLLISENAELLPRAIDMCEEAANQLLEEDAANGADQRREQQQHEAAQQAGMFSPREGEEVGTLEEDTVVGSSNEALEAIHILIAGSSALLSQRSMSSAERALRLAQRAVHVADVPLTTTTMAFAAYHLGRMAREPDLHESSAALAAKAAESVVMPVLRDAQLLRVEDHAAYFARCTWLLAVLGHHHRVEPLLNVLLAHEPTHFMGLLLLTLHHTSKGNLMSAKSAINAARRAYPQDPCVAMLSIAVEDALTPDPSTLHARLSVAIANIDAMMSATSPTTRGGGGKTTLKALCLHCSPGEEMDGDVRVSSSEEQARIASHWALLSTVALRCGALQLATVVAEAGLSFCAASKTLYAEAMCELLCTRVALGLSTLLARYPNCPVLRHNLLGLQRPPAAPERHGATHLMDALSIEEDDEELDGRLELTSATNNKNGSNKNNSRNKSFPDMEVAALFSMVLKAKQVWPLSSTAAHLQGIIRLLEAMPDGRGGGGGGAESVHVLSTDQRALLEDAAHFFQESIRLHPLRSASYMGVGVAYQALGALELSADFFASACEVQAQEPLLPYASLLYLYE